MCATEPDHGRTDPAHKEADNQRDFDSEVRRRLNGLSRDEERHASDQPEKTNRSDDGIIELDSAMRGSKQRTGPRGGMGPASIRILTLRRRTQPTKHYEANSK